MKRSYNEFNGEVATPPSTIRRLGTEIDETKVGGAPFDERYIRHLVFVYGKSTILEIISDLSKKNNSFALTRCKELGLSTRLNDLSAYVDFIMTENVPEMKSVLGVSYPISRKTIRAINDWFMYNNPMLSELPLKALDSLNYPYDFSSAGVVPDPNAFNDWFCQLTSVPVDAVLCTLRSSSHENPICQNWLRCLSITSHNARVTIEQSIETELQLFVLSWPHIKRNHAVLSLSPEPQLPDQLLKMLRTVYVPCPSTERSDMAVLRSLVKFGCADLLNKMLTLSRTKQAISSLYSECVEPELKNMRSEDLETLRRIAVHLYCGKPSDAIELMRTVGPADIVFNTSTERITFGSAPMSKILRDWLDCTLVLSWCERPKLGAAWRNIVQLTHKITTKRIGFSLVGKAVTVEGLLLVVQMGDPRIVTWPVFKEIIAECATLTGLSPIRQMLDGVSPSSLYEYLVTASTKAWTAYVIESTAPHSLVVNGTLPCVGSISVVHVNDSIHRRFQQCLRRLELDERGFKSFLKLISQWTNQDYESIGDHFSSSRSGWKSGMDEFALQFDVLRPGEYLVLYRGEFNDDNYNDYRGTASVLKRPCATSFVSSVAFSYSKGAVSRIVVGSGTLLIPAYLVSSNENASNEMEILIYPNPSSTEFLYTLTEHVGCTGTPEDDLCETDLHLRTKFLSTNGSALVGVLELNHVPVPELKKNDVFPMIINHQDSENSLFVNQDEYVHMSDGAWCNMYGNTYNSEHQPTYPPTRLSNAVVEPLDAPPVLGAVRSEGKIPADAVVSDYPGDQAVKRMIQLSCLRTRYAVKYYGTLAGGKIAMERAPESAVDPNSLTASDRMSFELLVQYALDEFMMAGVYGGMGGVVAVPEEKAYQEQLFTYRGSSYMLNSAWYPLFTVFNADGVAEVLPRPLTTWPKPVSRPKKSHPASNGMTIENPTIPSRTSTGPGVLVFGEAGLEGSKLSHLFDIKKNGALYNDSEPASSSVTGAGVVVVDRKFGVRCWVCAPTNKFGGFQWTWPKGTVDAGETPEAAAVREVFEETGLRVEIDGFLVDVPNDSGLGGLQRMYYGHVTSDVFSSPGDESQAIALVPLHALESMVPDSHNAPIVLAAMTTLK